MTRKLFSIALVVVLALALSVNAFAASPSSPTTPVIPSQPSEKPTDPVTPVNPSEAPDKTDLGVMDAEGNSFPATDVQIDGVADVNSLTGKDKTEMETAIKEVNNAASNGGKLVENLGLTSAASAALTSAGATGVKTSDLKIASTFNISVTGAAKAALDGGKALTFSLKVKGVRANMVSVALHYNGTAWEVIPSQVTADGVVKITLSKLSPVVIMTAERAAASTNPSNPSNPTNPSKPTTPTNPTTPTTPTNPSSPAPAPSAPTTNKVTSPQTSDVNLEGIILLTSALACAAACAYCMKRSQKA